MSRKGQTVSGVPRGLAPRYVEVLSPAALWLARRDCAESIASGTADFLFDRPVSGHIAQGSGRGPIERFTLAESPAIGKRALHGGMLGPLLDGFYLGSRRALEQVRTAARLESAGVPTPAILAVGTRVLFGPIRAHAIVSRELRDARNLYELAEKPLTREARRAHLLACADLLRRMHDAGFLHADLNVGNLVLERRDGDETLNVVDLDRGRFRPEVTPRRRLENLARLLRSYEKWMTARLRLTGREEIRFLRRYAGPDRALVRFLARSLARRRLRLGARRIRWRLTAPRSKSRLADPLE